MKREGRRHGMVRTYPISSERKQTGLDELASPLTTGLFTKVSSKPNNHSKFTEKCGRSKCHDCHIHPASKSRARSRELTKCVPRRMSCPAIQTDHVEVVDSASGFKVSGFSSTGVLDCLDRVVDYDNEYEGEDSDHEHDHDDVGFHGCYNHIMTW